VKKAQSGVSTAADLLRQGGGVFVLALVIWVNGLAGSGALSGESIGLIANRYRSDFLPADYVFSIWGLIYLGLLAFTAYQALPGQRESQLLRSIGWLWHANGLLNIAWIVAFSFSRFGAAMLVMLLLLGTLIAIHLRVGNEDDLSLPDRVFVAAPFGLYLAWISVALVANAFQYVTYLGVDLGLGGGAAWSALMMLATTALAAFMAWRRRVWIYPLVVAWALAGIAVRFVDSPLLASTGWVLAMVGVGSLVGSRRVGALASE
jgi:benzodiazapine receptor